jgi:hypothetical protein
MRRIGGTFNGTGADLVLCIGFVPDWVRVWNLEGTQRIMLEWNINMMRAAEVVEGIVLTAADQAAAALTIGTGLLPHFGGVSLTAVQAGTVTYGEGSYLKWDFNDYRKLAVNSPSGLGDASTVDVDKWTLDTTAANTGHFNGGVDETYIGEGSKIIIDGKQYAIVALTTDGSADDEVTLSHSVKSGDIQFISGMYDFKPMVTGEVTAEGFLISNTTVNVNDAMCAFEAGKYDN